MRCNICGREGASAALSVCADCIRGNPTEALPYTKEAHKKIREGFDLPVEPPSLDRSTGENSVFCNLCSNECRMRDGTRSYCGLRENIRGKMESLVSTDFALVHAYEDPLPTNCCAAWFCGAEHGYNLAVFFYGCNFDCLFCQNASHKEISSAPGMSLSEFVAKVHDRIKCVCYFGGSPEPQLPFAIKASELILERRNMRICWEWNGCGNEKLVKRAAELSFWSDGIIKFDLKAFDPNLSVALSGVPNERAYENFKIIANDFSQILTATTLLVPNYVGEEEVRGIAKFIASIDPDIPYSLLVFHPDFYMLDLGITPRRQVEACYRVAKRYLRRVNIGNRYLLPGS